MSTTNFTNETEFKKLKEILHSINKTKIETSDLKKYRQILINKLEQKCGKDFTKAVETGNGLVSDIPREISSNIISLGKTYYTRMIGTTGQKVTSVNNLDSLIETYSCYKALKVIYKVYKEVCDKAQEIRKEKNKKVLSEQCWTEEDKKEFLGALTVAKLAKSHKKFTLKVQAEFQANAEAKEVKVADHANDQKIMNYETDGGEKSKRLVKNKDTNNTEEVPSKIYTAHTPFGDVNITCYDDLSRKRQRQIGVRVGEKECEPKYTAMAEGIDKAMSNLPETGTKLQLIDTMIDYVKVRATLLPNSNIQEFLNQIQIKKFTELSKEGSEMAAALCGCLLFAESAEIRNPTRCKWEKYALMKVKQLIQKNCTNPFGVVFAGQKENKNDFSENTDKLYTPAIRATNDVPGGLKRASWLVTGKVLIIDILPEQSFDKFAKVHDICRKLPASEINRLAKACSISVNDKNLFSELTEKIKEKSLDEDAEGFKLQRPQVTVRKIEANWLRKLKELSVNSPPDAIKTLCLLWLRSSRQGKTIPPAEDCKIRIEDIPESDTHKLKTNKRRLIEVRKQDRKHLRDLTT